MDQEELSRLSQAFAVLDRNKDGFVGEEDLKSAFRKLKKAVPIKTLRDWLWEVDSDGDALLTLEDVAHTYLRIRTDPTGFEPYNLLNLFQFLMFDVEMSGYITMQECVFLLSCRSGKLLDPASVNKFFLEAKINRGAKEVSFAEFCRQVEVRRVLTS
eukprot:GILJ01003649.1.p2 GENE.GILJ01003649.1~~GILJ01003649.1.p2  ORF type:complete len:175 (-),score=23.74 GILJ01003649.1:1484-1954(-)